MALYLLDHPSRPTERPPNPFRTSYGGWQSGYRKWYVPTAGAFIDRGGGVLLPVSFTGAPSSNVVDVRAEFGFVARTETNGSTMERAFATPALPGPLDGLTAVTLAYWVYVIGFSVADGWWGQGAGTSCFCESANGATTGPFWRGGTDHRGAFTEVATAGVWQHLAWTADANNTHYYKNGRLAQTIAGGCGTISAADVVFYVGGLPSGSGAGNAAIDAYWADFRVYPFCATPGQIAELCAPATRWDLYWQPSRRVFFDVSAAAAASFLSHGVKRPQFYTRRKVS